MGIYINRKHVKTHRKCSVPMQKSGSLINMHQKSIYWRKDRVFWVHSLVIEFDIIIFNW
jgi:hypothetical protein